MVKISIGASRKTFIYNIFKAETTGVVMEIYRALLAIGIIYYRALL